MRRKVERTIFFARLSIPFNALLAVGKILVGVFTLSFFLIVNALYNFGVGSAKLLALKTHNETILSETINSTSRRRKQNFMYAVVGIIVIVFGALYSIYCTRMFIADESTRYPKQVALMLAGFSFTEIVLALLGMRSMRREREPMLEAIKTVNFATSLISLVLTQAAVLSIIMEGDFTNYIGISGLVFGGLTVIIGLLMLLRIKMVDSGKHAQIIIKRADEIINKIGAVGVRPIGFVDKRSMTLILKLEIDRERLMEGRLKEVQMLIDKKLHIITICSDRVKVNS